MKNIWIIFILIVGLTGCANEEKPSESPKVISPKVVKEEIVEKEVPKISSQFDPVSFTILVPSEATAMSLAHLAAIKPSLGNHVSYEIQPYIKESNELVSAFTSEAAEVIMAPTNLGAIVYQEQVPYQLVATLGWGNLYLISDETLTIDELAGRKITAFEEGSTSDFVLQMFLKEKGLLNQVEIEYLSSASDVQARYEAGETNLVVISEPFLSTLNKKVEATNVIVDFQKVYREWYGGTSYPQASLFIHKNLIENHQEVIEPLLAQIEASIEFANESPDEMAAELVKMGFDLPQHIARDVVFNSNLMFKTAEEAKEEIELYLQKLYEFDVNTVGGSLPNEDFYYLNK